MSTPVVTSLVCVLLAGTVAGQVPTVRPKTTPDPYTLGEPAALKKAGYESLGPFPFGANHDSSAITELLGSEPLLWIETAHFKIGCALSPLPLKNDEPWRDDWVARLKQELKRLATRLPRVKTDVKELDPWLRAHLVAQRVEELYAAMLANFGLTESSFPMAPDDPAKPAEFRGLGRHFGMKGKFTVLLLRTSASHARYTRAHHGREIADPIRFQDQQTGSLYWGASEETAEGLFKHDYALNAHLTFNLAHNLYSGYRSFSHDLPPWLSTGLAHWHARQVSPRFPTYDRKDDRDKEMRSAFWEWDKRVPGLLRNGAFKSVPALLDHPSAGTFDLEQHMQSWAVVEYLMTEHKPKFMAFVHRMKEPFHARRRAPTETEVRLRQLDVLQEVLGWSPEQLEAAWRLAVLGPGARGRK
ncbi:MAG: hypothetical protein WAT39_10360 [Planctomycetota bacterium]